MNRSEIIEAMARRLHDRQDPRQWRGISELTKGVFRNDASAALTALESTIPGLADVLDGKATIVPNEATADMQESIWLAAQLQNANSQYSAMLAATPYRRPTDGE